MTMDEEKIPYSFRSADDAPIPVPPVEEAWALMNKKLDEQTPVRRRWYERWGLWLWLLLGVVCVTGMLVVWGVGRRADAGRAGAGVSGLGNGVSRDSAGAQGVAGSGATGEAAASGAVAGSGAANEAATAGTAGTGSKAADRAKASSGGTGDVTASSAVVGSKGNSASAKNGKHASLGKGLTATARHTSRGNGLAAKGRHASWDNGVAAKGRHASWKNGGFSESGKHATWGSETGAANGRHAQWGNGTMTENGRHARWGVGVSRASTHSAAPKFVSAADSLLRALRSNRANASKAGTKKDKLHDRSGLWMEAGLSLSQLFPVGKQQSVSFNANAKSNIFSDYIPAPYFRLHIGSRLYVQTAFHFNSPQYIRSQRVDSTARDTANSAVTGYSYRTDLILKKLYYWDVPLSVHYRVFDGLSLGAGIQYSKLTGAIGQNKIILSPTNGGKDSVFDQHLISLKSDSGRGSYKKLSGSDWRILFEADYQWRRWTLGLRYSRGLKTYWPVQIDGSPGKDKNTSFSIHLYYDLWESSRKKGH
jgi:hypothetical protein